MGPLLPHLHIFKEKSEIWFLFEDWELKRKKKWLKQNVCEPDSSSRLITAVSGLDSGMWPEQFSLLTVMPLREQRSQALGAEGREPLINLTLKQAARCCRRPPGCQEQGAPGKPVQTRAFQREAGDLSVKNHVLQEQRVGAYLSHLLAPGILLPMPTSGSCHIPLQPVQQEQPSLYGLSKCSA